VAQRRKVEAAMAQGRLRAVVATSSLDSWPRLFKPRHARGFSFIRRPQLLARAAMAKSSPRAHKRSNAVRPSTWPLRDQRPPEGATAEKACPSAPTVGSEPEQRAFNRQCLIAFRA
jgi:hypothetical protein